VHLVLGDGRLTDLSTELEQLTMDSRSAPEWIGAAHLRYQLANLALHPRPPTSNASAKVATAAAAVE
jgi:hypothetical protein